MNDTKIIELIRKREHHAAVQRLYDHFPKIKSLIRSKGGNSDDAYDVFQESIVIFCRNVSRPDFELTSSLGTYLYSICWHLWKDILKKRKRNILMDDTTMMDKAITDSVQDHLDKEEKFSYLDKILLEIDKKCQLIFQMYYFEKQSMKQIAEKVGLGSEQSARNQKYKCMERARELARKLVVVH